MYDIGDPVPLAVTIYSSAGAAADATTVAVTITAPDGTSSTPSVTHDGTGLYSATYSPTVAGRYVVRWVATGTNASSYADAFDVSDPDRLIVGLADAKTYLRVTGTADDEQLRDVIEAASDLCERHTRKVWRRTTVTAELHSGGNGVLYLRQSPVVSVTSVTDSGTAVTSSTYTLDAPTGRLLYGDTLSGGCWTAGQENISVTYVTGPPAGIVPAYIRRGVLVLVEHLWATQRGGSNLPRLAGGGDEYDRRSSYTLPRRVMEMWGEPAPLVR